MLKHDKTNLYLLKNIPYMQHDIGYSLLLISESEIPEAFPDLHRIYESLETLAIANGKQHKAYKELLKYLDAIDDGISACDKYGNVTYINSSACRLIGADKKKGHRRKPPQSTLQGHNSGSDIKIGQDTDGFRI